ncbi:MULTISPECIES: helix-turn-helix domain-containing protein [Bacillus]|uniref:helix-turn-helix domain-containing protein n=2 Tax=Bacillaceae TaxID=186817 RepID=UPI000E59F594|nr:MULTISPECIES: helix-turn-helix transcriptional regulator [Bacillus]MCM3250437.1 helix-turn-helix domain-containing protein [Bacillus amyloliquefaciens]MCY7426870.1 helix-turn-helix domain-containing protein [Bacillus amyloliquefaciens]MEC0965459.1 helix-turn-helix domain-containing protein [Bacillus amyloliquefaciens]MEC1013086.1 helix-turn-helix domain-containing protein [Bacillus amyloliquefaciens]MEC2262528.1 helix-turn-helix domain-containing protein [Bacillus amyloliquefaciens]
MLGNRLKELRESRKLTQDKLAEILGISRGTYAHYEINKRKPDYDMLIKLADYYGVTTDFLLRGESQEAQDNIFNEEARRILEDPDTLVAAADGKITASILEAAQRIIAEQLKSGRQPGDIKNGNKK